MGTRQAFYQGLADAVLLTHGLFVAFVVLGLALIWLGAWRGWSWVRRPGFRALHTGAMGYVLALTLAGRVCPLTLWEDHLRALAGGPERYPGSFLQYWLDRLIYVEASESALTAAHLGFMLAVLLTLWLIPPRARPAGDAGKTRPQKGPPEGDAAGCFPGRSP